MDDRLPVLLAWPNADAWEVWCPYCQLFHIHGAKPGPRAAHCPSGPLKAGGYDIRLAAQVRRDRLKQPTE